MSVSGAIADALVPQPQMGMSFLIILEVFKFVGRKHKCAPLLLLHDSTVSKILRRI